MNESEKRTLKVGIIGAGVGGLHMEAYAQIPRAEVTAIAGLNDDVVKRLADKYGVPRTFHDYQDLLAAPGIEAVSVCLPNILHAPVTVEALRSGKHVLVEKPMALNQQEARDMIEEAGKQARVLMVAFNHRYRSDVQWIKRYIDSGALGRIYYAKAHWMRRDVIPRGGGWFINKTQAGGGPLIDLGVHVLDIALYLMGEPKPLSVSACTYSELGPRRFQARQAANRQAPSQQYEVEDLATGFIRLEGGATLLLEASWATHSGVSDDFGVTLYGTEGGVEFLVRNYTYENTVRVFSDVQGVPTDLLPKIPKREGRVAVLERFVDAVLDGAEAIPSGEDGLRRTGVIAACYESSASGHEISLTGDR